MGEARSRPMLAFEQVESRRTRAPAAALTNALLDEAFDRGLVLLGCGLEGNVVRILPPVLIADHDLDRGPAVLEEALRAAAGTG